jgi:fumarate hydratase class II
LKFEALKTGLVSEKDYNRIVDPKKMIYPAWNFNALFNILFK